MSKVMYFIQFRRMLEKLTIFGSSPARLGRSVNVAFGFSLIVRFFGTVQNYVTPAGVGVHVTGRYKGEGVVT